MLLNPSSQKKTSTPSQSKLQGINQLLYSQKNKTPIAFPNSSQVSPVGSDQNMKDFRALHSHKGSQVDVSNLTKLIKQSKQIPNDNSNSTQQIQVLLARAKEITGQFKTTKSMSHSRKESNEFKFKQAENKLNINNYPTLRDLINQKKSPKNENQLCRSTFNFEFVIGIGGFGKVWKVEHKKNNQKYAMKEMSKALIITKKSVNSVMNERTLLSQLKHQLLVNMYYAYQDRENLYLIMDYMKGGDLRYHIGRMRRFSEDQTRFFVACIFLGLEYIHSNNIIHRDIKPENLVLDENGYVHITDFGIARVMKPENSNDTSGTPGYMAPEVMYRQNHTFAVDYYALGVIAYEFMLGRRPYIGRSRQEIRDQIIAKQVQIRRHEIPEGWSLEGADFINRLILRKPQNRMGSNGSNEIREHAWFDNFPWDKLSTFEIKPPYVPNQTEDNFDQKQIIIEDEENNELIQQNQIILRDANTQGIDGDLFQICSKDMNFMEYYKIHLRLIQTLPRNTVGTLVKINSFLNQRNTMSDILMFQFVWILTNNLYCYMSQFKHLDCETHQDEKFIHYCQDCHYPLCPECLYPHTQLHKQKRQFPNIISLKGISQICLEKIKQNSNSIQNDLEDVEQQIHQFSINHANSQQVLKQIKNQMMSAIEEIFQQINAQLSMNMKEIQCFTKQSISPFIKNLQSLEQLLEQQKIIITQYEPSMIETINSVLGFDTINNYGQIKNDLKIHIRNIKSKQIHLKYEDYIEKLNKFGVSINAFFQITQEQNYQSFSDRKENLQSLDSIRSTKCKKPSISNIETQTAKQKLFFSSLNQFEITAPNYFLGNKKFLHFFQNESNLLHLLDLESKNGFEIFQIGNVSQFPSFHQSIATPDGCLYLIGGSLENGKKSAITYKMDFNTKKIVPKGNLNEGRSSFGICFQNNYIYAIGGYGNGQLVTKTCERYKDGQWELISNLNIGCANMSCCTFGNQYIFKFGGVKQTTEICHTIERYSIQDDEWEIIQPQLYNNLSRMQLTCLSASVQINSNDIMIMGGYDEQNQGSHQTMIFTDLGNGQYLLQEAEKKIVINEGFWNQNVIIEDNRLWMLQNMIDENEEDCIQGERNLLIFDGEWCKL